MGRRGALLASIIGLTAGAVVPAVAAAKTSFHPRVGRHLGLVPVFTRSGHAARVDPATGALTPVVYHGGSVMAGGVTVHTIFWAPSGYPFEGSPGSGVPGYEALIQQFFTDVAHDSGAPGTCTAVACNAFTVLPQYAEGTNPGAITPGAYRISYSVATDSVDRADPYPVKSDQCASPAGTATCVTDGQVTAEIDQVIQSTPGASRGLGDLWFVFLPPGVDECISADVCGTNAFAAYHSLANPSSHGATVYAVSVDPIIEAPIGPGADPQGFPDAEAAIDGAAHETVEAMTDPAGAGWMDPNGSETGDKCEIGPQIGSPLGYAPDGSPYNQVINGHQYLVQQMWANLDSGGNPGCVQATTTTTNQLPLPQVNLSQFNPVVSGNVNLADGGGIGVKVSLVRAADGGSPVVVAHASTTTAGDGSWSLSLAPHAVGDDRDEIEVDYSGASAPQPSHQVILTGNGGDPVAQAGWTGWSWLDAGTAASTSGGVSTLTLAPCSQTGVLSFSFDGTTSPLSPLDFCNSQTDAATMTTPAIGPKDVLAASSNDNRAFAPPGTTPPNLNGGLVSLTVPVGEPGSISAFKNPLAPAFTPTGVPSCTADLELQIVACSGLVPKATYQVRDRGQRKSSRADSTGLVLAGPLAVRPGDTVALSNGSRTLTTLHVAHLRVGIIGESSSVAIGTCQPGDYYGAPLASVPAGASAGSATNILTGGVALTGHVCPNSGKASGLPTDTIAQTDDRSGGLTETEVPDILDTSPIDGETVYGTFRALAESGFTLPGNVVFPDQGSRILLRILTAARGTPVFTAADVNTARGVAVPALRPGNYIAIWLLTNLNGDERLGSTRFIAQLGRRGPGPRTRVSCQHAGAQIACRVSFPGNREVRGRLRIRLTLGGAIVALGQGQVRRGRATVNLRVVSAGNAGPWRATLVLTRPHLLPVTIHTGVSGLG